MSESTFNIFGPVTNKDITVGYISTDRGYLEGVSVCDANSYAKINPGTTFIFKPNRSKVEFLNINQVNQLSKDPSSKVQDEACPDGLNMNAKPDPPKVVPITVCKAEYVEVLIEAPLHFKNPVGGVFFA